MGGGLWVIVCKWWDFSICCGEGVGENRKKRYSVNIVLIVFLVLEVDKGCEV